MEVTNSSFFLGGHSENGVYFLMTPVTFVGG